MTPRERAAVAKALGKIIGAENVLHREGDLLAYEYDASVDVARPDFVCFVRSADQAAEVMRLARHHGLPFLPRGAGTNLSGGSIPVKGGIVLETLRMDRVLEIDAPNLRAIVEPGLFNLDLQNALAPHGLLFAPDPASQKVSTLGGNVGENSGGPHGLKYGVTTSHVLGLQIVTPESDVAELGGKALDPAGYDLVGLFVGSEGTFGIATRITVRLMRKPPAVRTLLAVFDSLRDAGEAVSAIIRAGIVPATLEMMDRLIIHAVEKSLQCGYPLDAEAVLIIELDGIRRGMDRQAELIARTCTEHGAREVRSARDEAERDRLWAGRRGAFGAIARIRPNFLTMDATVPRTRLPDVLERVGQIARKHGVECANVFHAGDGNLHPVMLFDEREPGQKEAAIQAGKEILRHCIEVGGTISGEHGIGVEKLDAMPRLFSAQDIALMRAVKHAFDPEGICNPGKVLPPGPPATRGGAGASACPTRAPPAADGGVGPTERRGQAIPPIDGVHPKFAMEPASERHLAQALRSAADQASALAVVGGGTSLSLGLPPSRLDGVLSTRRLDGIVTHDVDNLTVTVRGGMPLARLQAELARHGHFLPLDPPQPERATVGGILAANVSGPRRLTHGAARDLTLGLKVALASGDVVHTGGRTVKNVSGYDTTKLFIGSLGTLGVILEATFRLAPRPEATRILVASFEHWDAAQRAAESVIHSDLIPAAVELTAGEKAITRMFRASGVVLVFVYEGDAEAAQWQMGQTQRLCRDQNPDALNEFQDDEAGALLARVQAPPGCAGNGPACKVSVPLSCLWPVMRRAAADAQSCGLDERLVVRSHVGSGIAEFHVGRDPMPGTSPLDFFAGVRERALEAHGHYVLLSAPPAWKRSHGVWAPPPCPPALKIMRRLKAALDPANILNPGRFVRGI